MTASSPSRRRPLGIALAAMLAHEIRIRLRPRARNCSSSRSSTTTLAEAADHDEADRIVKLVDRIRCSPTSSPVERERQNIHLVLEHVKRPPSQASPTKFVEDYDPSAAGARQTSWSVSPSSLVKNATGRSSEGIYTAKVQIRPFRPACGCRGRAARRGCRCRSNSASRTTAPGVRDLLPHLGRPLFTARRPDRAGACAGRQIIGDHGGIIECRRSRDDHPCAHARILGCDAEPGDAA
jgi:two-component system nitrogen regulation sensor histidine kinase GlnL